ncbi:MAG: HlyD family secretion protein [Armatimonadetes bacterium]|nr:HlyD family secretion protein [Armatimonadota bacterium]
MNNPKLETKDGEVQPEGIVAEPLAEIESSKPKKKTFQIIAGVAILAALVFGGRMWLAGRNFEATDDAYVTADIVQVSAEISGNVSEIKVGDNQVVKAGDLLATIDANQYNAALLQARANLSVAQANAGAALADVSVTQTQGQADILSAQGGASRAIGTLGASQAQIDAMRAMLQSARENANVARTDISSLDQDIVAARQALARAQAAVRSSQAAAASARASVGAARSSVQAAIAQEELARKQAARSQELFNAGGISAQANETAQTALTSASATRAQLQQQATSAESVVTSREADIAWDQAAVKSAQAALDQAILRRSEGLNKLKVAESAVVSSQSNITAAQQSAAAAQGGVTQAQASVNAATALPQKIAQKKSQAEVAKAQVEQAKAAVENAQLNVNRTQIKAPIDGVVSKRYAYPGSLLMPGSPVLSIVPNQSVYVVANFKETQVARMREGQPVEIEIDSLGGHVFEGTVESLSAATGSQFALIPPDNATGNFVKVVQRIPVRIKIKPDSMSSRLVAGMSASVKVKVSEN